MNKQLYIFPTKFLNFSGTWPSVNRFISLLSRSSADLDESVLNEIENNNLKPRFHPGVMSHSPVSLPEEIKNSISKLLSAEVTRKQMLKEMKPLERYLRERRAPIEKKEYFEKHAKAWNEVESSMGINLDNLNSEEKENLNKIIDNKVKQLLKKRTYSWNRINFTKYMGQLYVVARSAAEYSVLHKIFNEIYSRSNCVPETIFDFGSGMGSVIWAANSIWGKSVKEYYCVDSSSHMNELSEEIIQESKMELPKKIFYRQFLPASTDITYDIVVSAYSLLELTSKEDRLETINNLWSRTKKYLVLIEFGNKGGFKVLNEARDHILSKIKSDEDSEEPSHIFAPCPHHLPCPRVEGRCSFEASYRCFPQKPEQLKKEIYSYVIFKRGKRSIEDKRWPRIVQPVLCRSRHIICRVCSKSGDLKETIISPSKNGRIAYRCAKASRWGDLFPYNLKPYKEEKGIECEVKSN